jgi:Fe-S cluster assembly protein SufD
MPRTPRIRTVEPQPAGDEKDTYLRQFPRFLREQAGNGRSWTEPIRRRAIDRFAALGFPTTRDEAWRFTSVAPIARVPFRPRPGAGSETVSAEALERLTFEPWDCTHMVFVNGRHAPALSRLRPLPRGLTVTSLAEALQSDRKRIEPHLARHARYDDHAFTALNTAFMQDGAFVHAARGTVVEEPIHLLFVSTGGPEPVVSYPRNLVVAEGGARLTLIESYVGLGSEAYLTNAVTEIVAGEGAVIDHCKLQRETEQAFHVARLQAELGRGAAFTSHSVALGGALVRNDVGAILGAEGGDCTLNGLYVVTGRQHVDNHTVIDHASPRCASRELYKGVLDGASRGVFDGTIIVRRDAQKTDARQTNKNLLLSEEALVETNPRLQILADDVKCTHGATIGQLDEDAVFYLRSRGVGQEAARSMLTHAFVNDILDRLKVAPLRAGLECLMLSRLPRHAAVRELP